MWTAANIITAARILLTAPFAYLVFEGRPGLALAVFFIASVTDFIDGYVARRFGQQTSLGRLLDPLADKLLIAVAFIALAVPHRGLPSIPIWLAVAVISRDLLILSGSLVVYLMTGFTGFKPIWLGKINTFLELGLIVIFLATGGTNNFILPAIYLIVLASVGISGIGYAIEGVSLMRKHLRGRANQADSAD
jgi:cardiolipin synthase